MKLRSIFGVIALLLMLIISFLNSVIPASADAFADPAFTQVWNRTDQDVAIGKFNGSWIWGPEPRSARNEPYRESPGGQRLVQYFDKSRMEINNPSMNRNSEWFVTNGLLCKELVSGQMSLGDSLNESRNPAEVPVGGDLDSPVGPTYATFSRLASLNNDQRAQQKSGFVTETLNRQGQIGNSTSFPQRARYTFYENTLGHNVPDVFWNWMYGLSSRGVNWQYALGLPISEAYWSRFKIAGVEREVLVQLFERRALTFNPANDPIWQVEMGNIGLHYFTWRYGSAPVNTPAGIDAEESAFLNLINQYRAANGKGALTLNNNLNNVADWMSQDMAARNYFDHKDSQGRDPFQRMKDFGYNYRAAGENIAAGYQTAAQVFEGWKNSPGHNANMLNGAFTEIGIGRAYNAGSTFKWYWTTDFGSR
jgi:hypothetical protein